MRILCVFMTSFFTPSKFLKLVDRILETGFFSNQSSKAMQKALPTSSNISIVYGGAAACLSAYIVEEASVNGSVSGST